MNGGAIDPMPLIALLFGHPSGSPCGRSESSPFSERMSMWLGARGRPILGERLTHLSAVSTSRPAAVPEGTSEVALTLPRVPPVHGQSGNSDGIGREPRIEPVDPAGACGRKASIAVRDDRSAVGCPTALPEERAP